MILVNGKDCINFLQGKLTNDIKKINHVYPIQLNALCNLSSKVIGLFFIFFIKENNILLALPKNLSEKILKFLKKYAKFSQICFNITLDYHLIYSNKFNNKNTKYLLHHTFIKSNSNDILHNNLEHKIIKKINILNKLPFIDITNSECFFPYELNLDNLNVISYDKGCFLGQEIIARMKYLGKSKKTLIILKIYCNKINIDQYKIYINTKKIADIVNIVTINKFSYILAIINKNFNCLLKDYEII